MDILLGYFDKYTAWLLSLIGVVAVIKIVQYAFQYQNGNNEEKAQAVSLIRKTIILGGGVFFLVWIAKFVISEFGSVIPPT